MRRFVISIACMHPLLLVSGAGPLAGAMNVLAGGGSCFAGLEHMFAARDLATSILRELCDEVRLRNRSGNAVRLDVLQNPIHV
jgi:hypothetical protein